MFGLPLDGCQTPMRYDRDPHTAFLAICRAATAHDALR